MYKVLSDNRTGGTTAFKTTLEYKVSGGNLEFVFDCENTQYFSAYSLNNEPIYMGDVVEVFIGVGAKPSTYFEIEVAPNGAVFFAKIKNKDEKPKVELKDPTFKTSVKKTKSGYKSVISIPEKILDELGKGKLYFNAFRIETEGGETDKNLIALSPTLCGTFHKPEYFVPLDED